MFIPGKRSCAGSAAGGPSAEEVLETLEMQVHQRTAQLLEANRQLTREIAERKKAEQITRALFRISNAVNTTRDLGELYGSIHRILGEIIDLSNFFIAIHDAATKRISFPYFVDQVDSFPVYLDQVEETNSLTGEVLRRGKPIFLDRAELLKREEEKRLVGTPPHAWIGVPLRNGAKVIGVMAAHSYENPHPFGPIDMEILNSVSEQIALAIERKSTQQAIIASEKRYRNIIESIADGYFEMDLQGNLLHVNQALCRMLGQAEHVIVGMNAGRFTSRDSMQKLRTVIDKILKANVSRDMIELEIVGGSGEVRFVETVISAARNEDNQPAGFRGIARDISERKAAEASRKALEEQLQQSQRLRSVGTLAGGLAHDFNNLLMGIRGRTSLMLQQIAADHPHHAQLQRIEQCVESAASLTGRLLGFARGGKYEVRAVDLNALVEKSIHMFGRTRKEITITTALQPDIKPVAADGNQIEQVLVNLLVNAGQAMAGGGFITIVSSQIVLDEEQARFHDIGQGEYVQLMLSDTGRGMEREVMAKIFDPFFTTKAFGHGTGLGLAMVYGIIRNHAGAIAVESRPGEGTTFTILLPVTDRLLPTHADAAEAVRKGTETILLVDDEPAIIDVGRQLLAALGYTVLTAASGREALDIYTDRHRHIDLLIIDMIMPHMNGGELFDRLKKINAGAKVLLSSGYSIEGQAREILGKGCNGFIQKPFTIHQLSAKLRDILQ